ncbi:hypothetical protein CDIK_2787 [Cucumispora dikerogammari]|nr:hypothetical protein CDIK_2787 [Cucumispora dikerogammari]
MISNIFLTAISAHCEQITSQLIITQPSIVHAMYEKDRLLKSIVSKTESYSSIKALILFNESVQINMICFEKKPENNLIKILLFNITETKNSSPVIFQNQKPTEISPLYIMELKATFCRTPDPNLLILSLNGKNDILKQHPIVKYLKNNPSKAFQLRVVFSIKLSLAFDKEISDFIYNLKTLILPLREIIEKDIAITAEKINESRFKNNKNKNIKINKKITSEISQETEKIKNLKNITNKLKSKIDYYLFTIEAASDIIITPQISEKVIAEWIEKKDIAYIEVYKETKIFIKNQVDNFLIKLKFCKTIRKNLFANISEEIDCHKLENSRFISEMFDIIKRKLSDLSQSITTESQVFRLNVKTHLFEEVKILKSSDTIKDEVSDEYYSAQSEPWM